MNLMSHRSRPRHEEDFRLHHGWPHPARVTAQRYIIQASQIGMRRRLRISLVQEILVTVLKCLKCFCSQYNKELHHSGVAVFHSYNGGQYSVKYLTESHKAEHCLPLLATRRDRLQRNSITLVTITRCFTGGEGALCECSSWSRNGTTIKYFILLHTFSAAIQCALLSGNSHKSNRIKCIYSDVNC